MRETILTYIFCVLILCTLLLSILLQKGTKDKPAKRYMLLILSGLAYIIFNMVSEFAEGRIALTPLNFACNLLSFLAVDVMVISFSRYLTALLEDASGKPEAKLTPPVVFSILRMIVILVLAAMGKLFTIENGCYVEQNLSFIPYILSSVIMLMLLAVAIHNRSCFSTRQLTVIIIYLLLPVPPIIVELFTEMYSITGVSLTLSILLIYVLLQASAMEKARMREAILEEISSTDLLTNLGNRRSYYNRAASLSPEQNIGIVFCDMNTLKYTNDHFGHDAGDQLIKNYAALMVTHFRKDDVFRISGDEFVAIVPDIPEAEFRNRAKAFQSVLEKNNWIASMGSAYGTGCCFDRLISDAEHEMYLDKKARHLGRTDEK